MSGNRLVSMHIYPNDRFYTVCLHFDYLGTLFTRRYEDVTVFLAAQRAMRGLLIPIGGEIAPRYQRIYWSRYILSITPYTAYSSTVGAVHA